MRGCRVWLCWRRLGDSGREEREGEKGEREEGCGMHGVGWRAKAIEGCGIG